MMTKNMLSFRIFLITQTNTEMLNIVHVTEDAKKRIEIPSFAQRFKLWCK